MALPQWVNIRFVHDGENNDPASRQDVPVTDLDPLPVTDASIVSLATPGSNATSAAYEASRIVKSGPGTCYGLSGYNSKASTQFIQLFDHSELPADGAVPVTILAVAPAANFSIDFGARGRSFRNGIVVSNSSTGPTKTIGAADCWFDVQYV